LVDPAADFEAAVAAAPGRAQQLRRRARSIEPGAAPNGWDLLMIVVGDERTLAADIAATGGAAVAVSPPSLSAAVREIFESVIAGQGVTP
jgi:hypothetical protein